MLSIPWRSWSFETDIFIGENPSVALRCMMPLEVEDGAVREVLCCWNSLASAARTKMMYTFSAAMGTIWNKSISTGKTSTEENSQGRER
jgi:hypothetical protein